MITHHPKIKVTLIKTIDRTEGLTFDQTGKKNTSANTRYHTQLIPLHEYMGDTGGVRTTKSVRDAAGGFSLTLTDKMHPDAMESLYALIEPMDVILIRFCHNPHEYKGDLPLVMRGLVSEVRREESIGSDGKPSRKISVSGQDMGKLWQIFILYFIQTTPQGYLTEYKFFEKYLSKTMLKTQSANDFFTTVINDVLNKFVSRLGASGDTEGIFTEGFKPYASIGGAVSPLQLNSMDNKSLYQILHDLLDVGAFNELFIEDNEEEVSVILRPNPWRDVADKKIATPTPAESYPGHDAEILLVPAEDIQEITAARSDAGVANYFWAHNYAGNIISDTVARLNSLAANKDPVLNTPNTHEERFGLRKMEVTYQTVGTANIPGAPTNKDAPEPIREMDWLKDRIEKLKAYNVDNVLFETGTLKLRGNERIKAGRFIEVQRGGGAPSRYYVVSVEHDFVPYQGFFTTVHYERGTDFINRSTNNSSPYLKELAQAKGIS